MISWRASECIDKQKMKEWSSLLAEEFQVSKTLDIEWYIPGAFLVWVSMSQIHSKHNIVEGIVKLLPSLL